MATSDTILAKLDAKTLTSIVIDRKYLDVFDSGSLPEKYAKRVYDRETCLSLISKDLKRQTIVQFVQILHVDELKEWTKAIEQSVLTSKKINNPNNSVVMKKRLKEQLELDGLRKYIKKAEPSRKLLRATLDSLAVITESDNRTELVTMLFKQLKLNALEYILLELSNKTLQQMIVDSQLNIKLTTAKPTLVRHLVEMKDYVPKKMPVRERKPSDMKKKPKKPKSQKSDEKENEEPKLNMRTKPENIELVFESDDSQEFNPKSVVEMELSIDSKDDAEKHPPPPSYDESSVTGDSTESDEDFDLREKKKRRKRRNHKSKNHKKSKSRRRHSKKYFSSSSDDEGTQRKSHRKHRKHRSDKLKKYTSDEEKDDKSENPKLKEVTDDKDKQQKDDSTEKDLKPKNSPGDAETIEKEPKSKDSTEKDPKPKKSAVLQEKDKSDSGEEEKPPKPKKIREEDPKHKKDREEDPKHKKDREEDPKHKKDREEDPKHKKDREEDPKHKKDREEDPKHKKDREEDPKHKKDREEDPKHKKHRDEDPKHKKDREQKDPSEESEEDKDRKNPKKRTSDEMEDKKSHKKPHTDDLENKQKGKYQGVNDSEESDEKVPKKGKESEGKKSATNPEEKSKPSSEVFIDKRSSRPLKDDKRKN